MVFGSMYHCMIGFPSSGRSRIALLGAWIATTSACAGGSGDFGVVQPLIAPSAPSNVQVVAAGDSSVTIVWDPVAGATSYTVYLATEKGVRKANFAAKPGGERRVDVTSPAVITGLTKTRDFYFFVVTATDPGGESRESLEVTARPSPVSMSITGRTSLQLHEHGLLTASVTDFRGRAIALEEPIHWASSDSLVALVSSSGVVTASGRGTATIVASSGDIEATVDVDVHYRVKIATAKQRWSPNPTYRSPDSSGWILGIGDTIRLAAYFVDVDGVKIEEAPVVQWTSSSPLYLSVSPDGRVIGLNAASRVKITAFTSDGSAAVHLTVADVVAGRPAIVRFTHAVSGLGPITFVPSKGPPVTVSFGQTVESSLPSGTLSLETRGLPDGDFEGPNYATLVREGDHVSFIAGGRPTAAWLSVAWARAGGARSADVVRIRFAYAGGAQIAYLLDPDASPIGRIPEECYLDPGDVSDYFDRGAGDLDIFLERKYGEGPPESRQRVSGLDGRSMTVVITADTRQPLLLLLDP